MINRHFMTNHDRISIADTCAQAVRTQIMQLIPSCITCEHFAERDEKCKLVDRRPPAHVIAFGCESWTNEVPF
jgi:hypothetical protein